MADHLVDTNVLLVASASDAFDHRYPDVPATPDEVEIVLDWLAAFRDDSSRRLAVDEMFKIYEEYRNKLTDQHYGLQVVHHKMATLRTEVVEYDDGGHGVVPPGLQGVDRSDRKFVAAALNDPHGLQIVNATDSDWAEQAEALRAHGVHVLELLP